MSPSQGGQCGNGSTVALLSCFNLTKFDTFIPPHSFFEGSGLSEFENHHLSVFFKLWGKSAVTSADSLQEQVESSLLNVCFISLGCQIWHFSSWLSGRSSFYTCSHFRFVIEFVNGENAILDKAGMDCSQSFSRFVEVRYWQDRVWFKCKCLLMGWRHLVED